MLVRYDSTYNLSRILATPFSSQPNFHVSLLVPGPALTFIFRCVIRHALTTSYEMQDHMHIPNA